MNWSKTREAVRIGPSAVRALVARALFSISVLVAGGQAFCQVGTLEACPLQEIRSKDKLGYDFGRTIAREGAYLMVGDSSGPYDAMTMTGLNYGRVWVYELASGTWQQTAKLSLGSTVEALFGGSVALSGSRLAIGAPGDVEGSETVGAIYAYVDGPAGWTQEARVLAPDKAQFDGFGSAVDMENDLLVVGAPGVDSATGASGQYGAVYIFRRQSGIWGFERKLFSPSPNIGGIEWFGWSVATDGKRIVVGAPLKFAAGIGNPGEAFVYEKVGGNWVMSRLNPPVPIDRAYFGIDVDLEGTTIVVGRPSLNASGSGEVHTFEHQGGTWIHRGTISRGKHRPDAFGWSLDLNMGRLAVTSMADNGANYIETRVFDSMGMGAWTHRATVFHDDSPNQHVLGQQSTVVLGDELYFGDPDDITQPPEQGHLLAYKLVPPQATYCNTKPSSHGCSPLVTTVGAPSVSAGSGFFVECRQVNNGTPGLLLYSTTGRSALPFQGGTLCVQAPIRRSTVAFSGGNPPPAKDCSGLLRIDFNAFVAGGLGGKPSAAIQQPGTRVFCQWWGRDQGFPAPFNSILSDALEFSICM